MIIEECTNQAINISKNCIAGTSLETNIIIASLICVLLYVIFFLLPKILFINSNKSKEHLLK